MKLSKRALHGLKSSIKKWEGIVAKKEIDYGPDNCDLCKLYWLTECKSCPVYKKTFTKGCNDTPYKEWDDHHEMKHGEIENEGGMENQCPICMKLAKKELQFLKSLLPNEAT